jgi:hypothetical protein
MGKERRESMPASFPRPLALRIVAAIGATIVACAAAGCLQLPTGTGDPEGGTTGPAPSAASDGDGGTAGTQCGTDPQSGVTLCLGVAACPGVTIDPTAWPSCGFRITGGSALDLECLCNEDALCPIGVATSCDQATQLLGSQTQLSVCAQTAEQRCLAVATDAGARATPATAPAGTPTSAPPSGCNQTCLTGCGTAPDCLQVCGC